MIRVIQRRLIIPRGDTGIFTIPAMTQAEGAIGVFTIFDPITNTRIFQKQVEIEGENFNISFSHADTVNLKAGEYLWDIKFYKNPILADNKVIDGEEINSYYAAFQAPKCEIRETGDDFLMIEGQPAKIEDLNIILAATEAANAAKVAATEKAEEAAARLAEMVAAIPTKVSELENDSGYLQQETDPTVPAWAKAQTKPSYTAQEVGALPANTFIPSKVSDLTDDSGHYTKPANGIPASDLEETYLTQHQDISMKANSADLAAVATSGDYSDLANTPYIPTKTSDLVNDSNYPVDASYIHTDNNYTTVEKEKLAGIAAGAEVNVNADWNATSGDAQILNKPTNVSAFTNDAGYLTQHQDISGKANSADLAAVATSGSYEDLSNKPTIPEVPVQDVQVNGASVLDANGVANIPAASGSVAGVMKVGAGLGVDGSFVTIYKASNKQIKNGAGEYAPIVAAVQDRSAFYGLAKAAGDTTQSQSDNAVGTYTDSAKTAIQQMLGVPAASAIPTKVSQLQNDSGYLTSFTETDPTVPAWAKAAQKPSYTAAEVGAPTVQEMNTAIGNAIGNINSFDMAVVQVLPEQDISTHTIYLVPKTGETNDVYDEYVYINNAWEMVGNTQVDLSNYVQKTDYATMNQAGISKINNANGIDIYDNTLIISPASKSMIMAGADRSHPIVPYRLHTATFYGLAKAAGDTTQSQSENAIGTYTNEAKAAIRSMIGAAASADLTVQDVQVNGTSVVENGVANVPFIPSLANPNVIKYGTGTSVYLCSGYQHQSTFYGLAKAAGDTTQSQSNNAVGTYTDEAKAAIQTMLDVPAKGDVTVQDVQVNGTSILQDGVANVPVATNSVYGVVKVNSTRGIDNSSGLLTITPATESMIKAGTEWYKPLGVRDLKASAFYGLAKAAGADEKDSTLPVGTYTDTAKAAIRAMLGATSSNIIAVQDTQPTDTDTKIWLPETAETPVQIPTMDDLGNYVQKTDYASSAAFGVVRASSGLLSTNGVLTTDKALNSESKAGSNAYKPIVPQNQHVAAFYGLAKAAGDTTQSASDNAVGTYTDEAKTAIRTMLGAVGTEDYATNNGPAGLVKIAGDGLVISSQGEGRLMVSAANAAQVKAGVSAYFPIVPSMQHQATFYGLAKASGDTTQSASSNAVGVYTDNAKASIKAMLGIQDGSTGTVDVTGTTPTITAVENTRYVCGEVTSLNFTPAASGICIVRFTSGSTVTVLTIPNTVKFPEWFDPTSLETNTIYEICITDGTYGAVMSWAL